MTLQKLKQQRDDLNVKTKELISESRESTQRVKKHRTELKKEKQLRDSENEQVKNFKAKRNEINKKIKTKVKELNALQETIQKTKEAMGGSIGQTRKQLETLEWEIQTNVLDVRQEEKLARRIGELEEMTKQGEEFVEKRKALRKIKSELDELRKEAQAFHEVVLTHAKASEDHHKSVQEVYKKIKNLEPSYKEVSAKINAAKREADEAHKLYLLQLEKVKGKDKVDEIKRKSDEKKAVDKRDKNLKKRAEELFKEFQNGKKLSTEELQIIQSYS